MHIAIAPTKQMHVEASNSARCCSHRASPAATTHSSLHIHQTNTQQPGPPTSTPGYTISLPYILQYRNCNHMYTQETWGTQERSVYLLTSSPVQDMRIRRTRSRRLFHHNCIVTSTYRSGELHCRTVVLSQCRAGEHWPQVEQSRHTNILDNLSLVVQHNVMGTVRILLSSPNFNHFVSWICRCHSWYRRGVAFTKSLTL